MHQCNTLLYVHRYAPFHWTRSIRPISIWFSRKTKKKEKKESIIAISKCASLTHENWHENWPFFSSIGYISISICTEDARISFLSNLEKADAIRILHSFCVIASQSFFMLPVSSQIRITAIFFFQRFCGQQDTKTLKLLNYPILVVR